MDGAGDNRPVRRALWMAWTCTGGFVAYAGFRILQGVRIITTLLFALAIVAPVCLTLHRFVLLLMGIRFVRRNGEVRRVEADGLEAERLAEQGLARLIKLGYRVSPSAAATRSP